ncbi:MULTISPECIES: NADP-dependent oxidoreductase [unclassified Marinobacter]|jgi:NADPH2:quinone reductase|uniref:NADP-dependent oxidoreductase n=1 Tax=unclassified Marinobacter TaxID=83889 RepID=UPI000718C315|nr:MULTISPECIES: NADP-dependent oxidoreductase [unclassified Marinobacter]MDX5440156.1 NADP-dependent oxidoreductase [Alteromonadaceae bacterium]AMQ89680.1 alcohol dehydrogenase [Marinobacter sp. LQ44]MDX5335393.1 NADP-dependent oxidoreductase [Marinobacter sp.]MDX5386194.1 NADP-dependent oxidoreductase [Marinobacter sp.]MDX5471701.1 NADP-dependent oxidoreductase [Marinobacter sp.]
MESSDLTETGTMRHVVYDRFGERDVLRVTESPIPQPGEGEVLVRVHGAGLNPIDWKTRKGMGFVATQIENRLPWTPGYDAAGEVVEVGEGVTTLVPGDRVMGMIGFPVTGGAYAEYAIADAEDLAIVPEELDLIAAAGVPLAALTAWQALFEVAELESGQKILIHAGAGGVGHFAVQFALERGAHVIVTASSRNRDFLAELGVHEVIDYHTTDFTEECYGLDVVLDLVGGETGKRSLQTLSDSGVLVTIPTVTADDVVSAAEAMGVRAHGMRSRPDAFHLDEIAELIEDGDVKVHVEQVFSLDQVQAAHELLEGGHVRGKLVLDCR